MKALGGLFLAAATALTLSACSTTTVASPKADPTTTSSTTTTTSSTTTTVPTTTVPPTTEATTTTSSTTTTTTTTVPVNEIAIEAASPAIEAVGQSDGEATQRAQERLLELGFWLASANGDYDLTTQQAVMAFQKYFGLEADGSLGPQTAAALTRVTIRPQGRTDAGTLVEIDKGLQVLIFVEDGVPKWILNTSTGSEVPYEEPDQNTPGEVQTGDSVTRNGLWAVYRQREEGWWEGDLGRIYRPKYFTGGIAVHGSNSVPNYPASHGCVRVSVPAMDWIWDIGIMPMDTPVWVHEGSESPYPAQVAFAATQPAADTDDA